jgi:hypothetical protein
VEIHLGVGEAFEGGLHEGAEEAVEVIAGRGLRGDVLSELLDFEFEVGIPAGNLRKEGN